MRRSTPTWSPRTASSDERRPAIVVPRSLDELVDTVAYATTLGLRVVVTGEDDRTDDRLGSTLLVDPRGLSDVEPGGGRHAATPAPVAVC